MIGFAISSRIFVSPISSALDRVYPSVDACVYSNLNKFEMYPHAWQYFLLPGGGYSTPYPAITTMSGLITVIFNALFNALFQPVFLCIFTPQTIATCVLFPFFIYGAIAYFRRIPLLILFFFAFSLYIGMRDFVVEPLIRHRTACELIFYMIGVAGLGRWITKRS